MNYHNYNMIDGKSNDDLKLKSTLKKDDNKKCTLCESNVYKNDNYCKNCGNMTSCISEKEEVERVDIVDVLKEKVQNLNLDLDINLDGIKSSILSINMKNSILISILSIIFISITILTLGGIIVSNIQRSGYYTNTIFETNILENIKIFISILLSTNIPNWDMSIRYSLISAGKIELALRVIILPLIAITSIFISTKLMSRKTDEDKVLKSLSTAVIYTTIMLVLGILVSYKIPLNQSTNLLFRIDLTSLAINSLVISSIGTYLGMYKKYRDSETIFEYTLNKAIKTVLIGFLIVTFVVLSVLYITYPNIYSDIQYAISDKFLVNDNLFMYIYVLSILSVVVSIVFTIINFGIINILGIFKYSIFNIIAVNSVQAIILLVVICLLFVKVGRNLKKKYENIDIRPVLIFCVSYALVVALVSYSTHIVIEFDSNLLQSVIGEFINELQYMFGYEYGSIAQVYINQLYNTVNTDAYIGFNSLQVFIVSFIYSYIFVYIGYKTNKIKHSDEGTRYE